MSIYSARIRILYVIMGVLLLVSVVPMYFYADLVVSTNRDSLKRNEQLLQTTVTRALSDDLSQRQVTMRMMLENLSSSVQVASGNNFTGKHVEAPELRALLEKFVSSYTDLAWATLLNSDAKGITAGKVMPDVFVQRDLEHAFAAARDGRAYTGQPVMIGAGKASHTVVLISQPLMAGGNFVGMVGAVMDLKFLIDRLRDPILGGLHVYVVDQHGRLVAGSTDDFAVGQDMARFNIVGTFTAQGGRARFSESTDFNYQDNKKTVAMMGTYSPVPSFEWAVIAQKDQANAYASAIEMQDQSRLEAFVAVLLSVLISLYAARKITTPLQTLTESSRAIARGDFSQRVHLKSRTEFGELADTFNTMSGELERYVEDLKRAAAENRELFLNSIQMLAGAVDEKDPYTRGHSDRVTRYSILIATELGLSAAELDNLRIAAQLHDVGKIGIEDRILKKPGALTPEEYEVMKTHTTRGANILRPVEHLREMLPGIESHHESLDGRGYPHGLKGDEIPLMPRIISVADTFDAMTTDRPYQAARDPEYVIRTITSLVDQKFDRHVVAALTAVYKDGRLRLPRTPLPVEQSEKADAAVAGNTGAIGPASITLAKEPIERF